MRTYQISAADRRPLPQRYRDEPRHLGYCDDELERPFAHHFRQEVEPIQRHAIDALLAGRAPSEFGYEVDEVVDHLSRPGYDALETGWTRTSRGTLAVSCLTDMPGVTAQMWDWWFGWHSRDSARYKLWHPGAHQFAAIGDDRSSDRSLSDRQRYHDNVSYVDEYVGQSLSHLAIRFLDPARVGFDEQPGVTHICARLGTSNFPVGAGWLVHQVRPTDGGSEMRSRFFLGHPEIMGLPPTSTSNPAVSRVLTSRAGRNALKPVIAAISRHQMGNHLGRALVNHCATEMNHLATFLADLYAEFRDYP